MLTLPPNITKKIYCVKKNTVCRCYGQDNIVLDNTNVANIKSRTPFIFEQEEKRILFTSNPQDNIPEDCPYAILVNRKPTETSFTAGVLNLNSATL